MTMNEKFKGNTMAVDEKSILDPTWPKCGYCQLHL
jgi:hypothetical protein